MDKKIQKKLKDLIVFLENNYDVKIIENENDKEYVKGLENFLKKNIKLKSKEKITVKQDYDILSVRILLNNGINFFIRDLLYEKDGIKKINKEVKGFRNFEI